MKKILVVDDEWAIRLLYEEELSGEGYEVITSDGDEGILEVIGRKNPDLVVMDMNLKGIDGQEAFRQIRQIYSDLPVILCAAYPKTEWGVESTENASFVVKSSDLSELKSKIHIGIGAGEDIQGGCPVEREGRI
jgi:CheY-like chemotaxis protein